MGAGGDGAVALAGSRAQARTLTTESCFLSLVPESQSEGGVSYTLAYTATRPVHAPSTVNGVLYEYDANGNLEARGGESYAYDGENRLQQVTTAAGETVTFTYDGDGRRVMRDTANSWGRRRVTWVGSWPNTSNKHEYQYDERGRVAEERVWLDGASYQTGYSPGLTSRTGYYADDQVETITYPDGEVVTTTYTAQGLPETLKGTLPDQYTNYPYIQSTTYNPWGQPTQVLLGNGLITQYTYHPLNSRLTRIQTSSLFDLGYAYDLVGNVGSIYDATRGETLCYAYDPLDRLTRFEQAPSPLKPITIRAKGSNADGWPIMQLRVNGVVVQEWTVDATEWMTYTTQAPLTGDDQIDVVFTNDYCVPTGCQDGDRNLWVDYLVVDGYTVDVVTGTEEVAYDRGWGETAFDGQDVIPGQEGMYWAGALRAQVVTGSGWTVEEEYAYNEIGNLISKGGVSYTYPPSGPTSVRPHVVSSTSDGQSFGYDANGNMTAQDGATLTWDAENRLESVAQDGRVTTFTYDADGRRVKKETPWGTTYYVGEHYEVYVPTPGLSVLPGDVDLDCRVSVADIQTIAGRWGEPWSLEYDVDQDGSDIDAGDIQTAAANWPASVPNPCNQATTKYYRLGGRLIALRQNGQLHYVHTDHLGSLSLLADENGRAVPGSLQRFYPFGKTRTGQPVILPTERNFTGQQLDANTGLLYYASGTNYGRYYDPAIGRFVQPDPIVPNPGNPQDLNRYSYVRNNPLKYTDSTGRWLETIWDIANIVADIHTIRQEGLNWTNGLALAVDVGTALLPGVPAFAGVVTKGGKAVARAEDILDVVRAVNWTERFAGASPEVMRGIGWLEKLVKSERVWAPYRRGLAAELLRAEEYFKAGKLRAVEAVVEGGRVDLILVTEEIVEVKYWRESYAKANVPRLLNQIKKYQTTGRPIVLELVRTKTNPVTEGFIEYLLEAAQAEKIPLTRDQIRIITLGGP